MVCDGVASCVCVDMREVERVLGNEGGPGINGAVSTYVAVRPETPERGKNERQCEFDGMFVRLAACSFQFEQRESVAASWRIDKCSADELLSPGRHSNGSCRGSVGC